MKPLRILIFFFSVFGLLFLLSVIFPDEGIRLSGNIKLRFASSKDLFARDSARSAYTDSLIHSLPISDDPEFGEIDSTLLVLEETPSVNIDSIRLARIDSISKRVYPIHFRESGSERLHRFFEAAASAKQDGKVVRILHYGDSQIENDRMTSLLRYRMQRVFGGSGIGMVSAIPLYYGNPAFSESWTGNWIRYTGFGKRDTTIEHAAYGAMMCFTSIPMPEEELPSLQFNFIQGRKASRFSDLRIFLHSYVDSGMVMVRYNDTITDTIFPVGDGYQVLNSEPGINAKKVEILFSLDQGGRIYGISFDPPEGVQVDNIAMRGSSGSEFSRTDQNLLDTMLKAMDPGLVILQFGGNVVPYITNFNYYRRVFSRELRHLRSLMPNTSILVIGPSDMATKSDGEFTTFATLEPVRNVLREAALDADCGFWDMYEAMGGRNSIQDFVMAEPPLATSDYIHFTNRGANLMAGMVFDAIMLEYEKWKAGIDRSQEVMARSQ